jgi:flagellar biosynthesis/type III secretory pathway protein FliH
MSSSELPRAVALHPAGSPAATVWAPDELPSRDALAVAPRTIVGDDAARAAAAEDGYARGYEQGFRAGEFAEAARLRSAAGALESALESVEQESARWIANAEEHICALAVTVARHVMGRELAADPRQVLASVRMALGEFPVTEGLRVRLNPMDLQSITTALAGDPGALGNRGAIRWSADARMAPGGCLIEGQERIVDGRIDVALERLYRRLTSAGS